MCIVSRVMDHYKPLIPDMTPAAPVVPWVNPWEVAQPFPAPEKRATFDDIAKMIREFMEAKQAAERIDVLTKQPDCVDPEKAKLEGRVRQLEALLNSRPEFVIVKEGGVLLQPGRYRVVDGELHQIIEVSK